MKMILSTPVIFGAAFLIMATLCTSSAGIQFIPTHLQNDYGDALEAIFSMGVKLEALLYANMTTSQNFLISPLSITLLLGQLMVGAEGEFKQHLYDLATITKRHAQSPAPAADYMRFHLQLGRLLAVLRNDARANYTLATATALFVNKRVPLLPVFEHESETLYRTVVYRMNFAQDNGAQAMNLINQWASEHTNGLIRNVLPAPPGASTAAIFANALYFNGRWEQPFSADLNTVGPFLLSATRSVPVTYMVNFLEQVPYAESERLNCKMLVLPYVRFELGMYILLPNKGHPDEYNINAFSGRITVTDFLEMLAALRNRDVNVKVPKFSLTSSLSLLQPLQMYAAYKKQQANRKDTDDAKYRSAMNPLEVLEDKKKAFQDFKFNQSQAAQDEILLEAATANRNLRVSDVVQHMTFSMNEMGTEAAAVSAGIVDYSGGSKNFLANKPFTFFIRHEATGTTLFWGTIANPASK